MKLNKIALALSLAAFAMPLTALAQDAAPAAEAAEAEESTSNLSWNLSVTSDYVFRGITQTNFEPALQGGLDYAFGDSGWYVGAWASNIDFAASDGPDIELDTYIGYGWSMSDAWAFDVHAVQYTYLGEQDSYGSLDYAEFFIGTTFNDMLTLTYAYAPDYANADISSSYVGAAASWEVGSGFSLNAGLGYSKFSDDVGSYTDWNLGISRSFGPVEAALTYYDTSGGYIDDLYGDDSASDTVVLSLKISGPQAVAAAEPIAIEAPQQTCADLDDDGDGVNNCNDKCPGSAAGEAVGADGCPVPAVEPQPEPEPVLEPKPFRG